MQYIFLSPGIKIYSAYRQLVGGYWLPLFNITNVHFQHCCNFTFSPLLQECSPGFCDGGRSNNKKIKITKNSWNISIQSQKENESQKLSTREKQK
jgi:hypothetical protein